MQICSMFQGQAIIVTRSLFWIYDGGYTQLLAPIIQFLELIQAVFWVQNVKNYGYT